MAVEPESQDGETVPPHPVDLDDVEEQLEGKGIFLSGKAPSSELGNIDEPPFGLENFELMFFEDENLDPETAPYYIEEIGASDYTPCSVHTQHKPEDEKSHFQGAAKVADRFGVPLVLHTQYGQLTGPHLMEIEGYIGEMEEVDPEIAFEQNPETARRYIISNILGYPEEGKNPDEFRIDEVPPEEVCVSNERNLVIDTAHEGASMSHLEALQGFKFYLDNYMDKISAIHLNNVDNSGTSVDGKAFAEGDLNMKSYIYTMLDRDYEGPVVVEVPPGRQQEDIEYFLDHAETYLKWEEEIEDLEP